MRRAKTRQNLNSVEFIHVDEGPRRKRQMICIGGLETSIPTIVRMRLVANDYTKDSEV